MNSGMEGYFESKRAQRWQFNGVVASRCVTRCECFTMVDGNVVDLKLKRNEANELGNKITDQVLNSHG